MNPTYARLRRDIALAIPALVDWTGSSVQERHDDTDVRGAVELACAPDGKWKGMAVFIAGAGGWTVLQDLSGHLGWIPAAKWAQLAGDAELVVAGYNDSIRTAELTVVRAGSVVREFRHDADNPDDNVSRGSDAGLVEFPCSDWVDVAGYVDSDPHGFAERGTLLILETR